MNDSLKAAGDRCGVDVDALYKKYACQKRVRGNVSNTEDATRESVLDNMLICKRCNGYGLIKEHYNYQVKEINCTECDGDGVIQVTFRADTEPTSRAPAILAVEQYKALETSICFELILSAATSEAPIDPVTFTSPLLMNEDAETKPVALRS
eukprot:CCRYP_000026-RD/>CCRYP_000026-RD protein AED:0.42 eAED:1.00 QI:0/0/0/1/0/0/2/0/151